MRHNQFIKIALSIILGLVCIAAHADDKTVIRIKYVNPTTRSIVEDVPKKTSLTQMSMTLLKSAIIKDSAYRSPRLEVPAINAMRTTTARPL